MTQVMNYNALNDFLENQTDDISSIYLWYEKLSEYDLEGTESPRELDTIFHAMKFLMSFSFTAAEELREVAEREAVLMAEKEEAWEEQKIALKEELDTLRERITVSAEAGDSTEAFRAQIDSLREENRELEKTNRDRDREMADLRDRFESLVSRADMLTRERDALEQHRNQMEDTIRELQRRISAKSEETTNEWESRKLRQRNEQAVTLIKQMHAVVLQNDELREEVTRVGDALEEATRIIKESSTRYAELTAQHDATRRDLRAISEENAIMREKLEASSTMLATVETEAMDVEQSTAAKLREMNNRNRELREELYATQRELEEIRQLADSMNHEEKEAELEKLRSELIEATKTARSLYGELTSKSSTDPTVAFQLRIMQLESHLEQSNEKIAAQKKALEELEDTLVSKDKLHGEIAAELERLRKLKFGDARDELKRLTTQLSFRDEQIARLTNHCTLLQIELGTYAERSAKLQRQEGYVAITAKETQTNGGRPDVVPHSDERSKLTEKKSGKSSKPRNVKGVEIVEEERNCQQEVLNKTRFDQDVWEQQTKLMVSLYSELMQIMEEQEVEKKQMTEMEEVLFKGRRAMDDAKSHLLFAYEEIYRLKKNQNMPEETENEEKEVELVELRRLVSALETGGTEMERQADETTRKLITEQIERIRLSRMNTALRRKCDRAEQTMRRAREKMVIIETHTGKRCAQLQYQLDTALIDLANCQSQLVRSVSIETYEKLALRFKKECISEVLESEIDEVWKDSTVSIAAPTDVRAQELEAKNSYLKKIVEVISEQNDFWSKETEILQNENEELKRFVEDMENESDLKNILASIEQRLLETIREQQEDRRDHERAYRKAREVEEKLGQERSEWSAQRSRFLFAVRTLQSALSNARLNTLNSLSLIQIEKLKAKIQEIRENEMLVEDNKEKIERMRDKLQQKLALQEGARKAKDAIDEENADVLRLERRLQAVYSSLEMQKVENNRLESTVKLKEAQLSDLKEELTSVKKENEDLMTAIASANLWGKSTENKTVAKDEDHADLEERSSTVIRNSPAKRFLEGSQVSSDDSEASSTDSERGTVKTVLQDNSREFEKRLAKMKEAAELCIQGYKNQLLQKDQAVEMYRQLAEEKLSTRPQNTLEKEIVREEIRVVDEQTEERLRHALGDVARLKEEIEELEKANRALYRKRRKSVVPTVDTVDCQTDPIAGSEDNEETKETRGKTKTSSRNSTESTSSNTEDKFEAERQRYKNEIKQLQGRLRRVIGNNKELTIACEKIRDDAMAELEMRVPRTKEVDEQAMIRIRVELDKARKENRALRKIIEKQKISLESFKKEVVLRKSGEEEMARWIERKKLEESLSSVRKKLVDSLEKEKVIREKLSKRERILEEFRRDEEVRQRELDRTRKKCAELQYERDKALRENTEVHVLQKKLLEESAKLEQNEKDISSLSSHLKLLQHENMKLLHTIEEVKVRQIERTLKEINPRTTSSQGTQAGRSVTWKEIGNDSTKSTQTSYTSPIAQVEVYKKLVKRKDVAVEAQLSTPEGVKVTTGDTVLLQLKETEEKTAQMERLLDEVIEKLKTCEKERQRLVDTNKLLVEQIECNEFGSLGAVNILVDKLQAKDREIIQLRSQLISLAELRR